MSDKDELIRQARASIAKLLELKTEQNQTIGALRKELADAYRALKDARRAADRAEARLDRAQELELRAEKRITAALGAYDGDWLDEAVERLSHQRDMTLDDVVAQLIGGLSLADGDHKAAARHLLTVLGVTVRDQ